MHTRPLLAGLRFSLCICSCMSQFMWVLINKLSVMHDNRARQKRQEDKKKRNKLKKSRKRICPRGRRRGEDKVGEDEDKEDDE